MREQGQDNGDVLTAYLQQIGREPLLTKEEEVELAIAIERCHDAVDALKRGGVLTDEERATLEEAIEEGRRARQRFINANLRLVVSIAKKYRNQGMPLLDLIQEGNLGLMRAVEKFDHTRGFKFSTYATWWIRQAIQRAVASKGRTIRIPVHLHERVRKVRAAHARLSAEKGREPTNAELATAARVTEAQVAEAMEVVHEPTVSLQWTINEDTELGALLEDLTIDAPDDAVESEAMRAELEAAMRVALSERESAVLGYRYGLVNGPPLSLRQVGERLGLSRERVRQIEITALEKLRGYEKLSA